MIGAAMPMESYPGIRPMAKVVTPINIRVMTRSCFRPMTSPSRPKTNPPTGRATYPTAYVEKASRVPVSGSLSGKKTSGNTRAAAAE
ncbi:unannotated protein [freshwater metagenome]|uniref:Unannotated protein n=1 Tax=freshwater metagenome TaxID=449393 RepID=A0A6J7ENX8_9ZZZZ